MQNNGERVFKSLKLTEIMPGGWIGEYISRDIDGFVGHLDEYCKEASTDIFGSNRVRFAKEGFWSSWWDGEIEGNWIDGFIRTAFLSNSEWARNKAEKYIRNILKHQEEDGYIGIYQPDCRYISNENDGELWCQSRIMLAMLGYYEATGDREVFDAVYKCARLTVSKYGPEAGGRSYYTAIGDDCGPAHGLSIIEPMLLLYEITGEERFLEFSVFLYDDFSSIASPLPLYDDLQLGHILDAERPFLSHGVHTCEHLRIPLLLYKYTGEEKYRIAYRNAYNKIKKYIGISGACKSDEWIGATIPEDEVRKYKDIKAVLFESVPLPEAGYEYCATTELFLSLNTAFIMTGDTDYVDMAERLLFNAAMAARLSNGKAIGYLSADNLYSATKADGERWDYSSTHDDAAVCCIANAGRIMPHYISNMWVKSEDGGLAAVYYGPCHMTTNISGTDIEIIEQTLYPFENRISFNLKLSSNLCFTVRLRLPKWCTQPTILVNGNEINYSVVDGFAVINREWRDKDNILLNLPSEIKIEKAVDGSCAVVREPLVYSLKIKEDWKITRKYKLEGFYDMDCVPAEGEKWNYVLKIEESEYQKRFFRLIQNKDNESYPWDESPIEIEADVLNYKSQPSVIKLIPIGCTNLRRTCFPYTTFFDK